MKRVANSFFRYPEVLRSEIDEDPDGFFQRHLAQARKGRFNSAEELLRGFCNCVERKIPVPSPILEYLYVAFAGYLTDGQPTPTKRVPLEKGLLLTRPRHRPRNIRTADPDCALATLYLHIKRDAMPKERAKDCTAKEIGLSKRVLEDLDCKWGPDIDELTIQELEQMLGLHKQ